VPLLLQIRLGKNANLFFIFDQQNNGLGASCRKRTQRVQGQLLNFCSLAQSATHRHIESVFYDATRRIEAITMENAVSNHKFKIGQSVNYTSGPFGAGIATGVYKITRLLPPEGNDFQYKIKRAAEPHERVAKESQLDRIDMSELSRS
jgi:hypothetical protein